MNQVIAKIVLAPLNPSHLHLLIQRSIWYSYSTKPESLQSLLVFRSQILISLSNHLSTLYLTSIHQFFVRKTSSFRSFSPLPPSTPLNFFLSPPLTFPLHFHIDPSLFILSIPSPQAPCPFIFGKDKHNDLSLHRAYLSPNALQLRT